MKKSWGILFIGLHFIYGGMEEACLNGDKDACLRLATKLESRGDIRRAKAVRHMLCESGYTKACSVPSDSNGEASSSTTMTPYFAGRLRGDLDYDGQPASVGWRKIGSNERGSYYQLLVVGDEGKVLWKGPARMTEEDPLVFFELDTGISLPRVLVDLYGDGERELLAPMPQSDVSPTVYRRLHWNGDGFDVMKPAALLLAEKRRDRFIWRIPSDGNGIWISDLNRTEGGEIQAEVSAMDDDGHLRIGRVLLHFSPGGADVVRILEPLKRIGN